MRTFHTRMEIDPRSTGRTSNMIVRILVRDGDNCGKRIFMLLTKNQHHAEMIRAKMLRDLKAVAGKTKDEVVLQYSTVLRIVSVHAYGSFIGHSDLEVFVDSAAEDEIVREFLEGR